jgi:hypothetical protein
LSREFYLGRARRHTIGIACLTRRLNRWEAIAGGTGEAAMLEYLGYAVFLVAVFGCLYYIMNSLETEQRGIDPKL